MVAEKAKEETQEEDPVQEPTTAPGPVPEAPLVGVGLLPQPLKKVLGIGKGAEVDEEKQEEEEEEEDEEEEEEDEDEDGEETPAPIVRSGPPVLGQIPHVASYSAESKLQPQSDDVERIAPAFIPISEMTPINASQADFAIAPTEERELEPEVPEENKLDKFVTADSEEQPAAGSRAEEIARRVFAAPVEETSTAPEAKISEEIDELTETTADTKTAPVVDTETKITPAIGAAAASKGLKESENVEAVPESSKAIAEPDTPKAAPDFAEAPVESTKVEAALDVDETPAKPAEAEIAPASIEKQTESTQAGVPEPLETSVAVDEAAEEPRETAPEPSKPSGELFPPTKTTTETTQPERPVADRIAPPVVATAPTPAQAPAPAPAQAPTPGPATTETTVSGPGKSSKEKDSGSVSGWLKSKFSRRSSKPKKPESASSGGPSTLTKATPAGKKSLEQKSPGKMSEVVPIAGPAGTIVFTEPKGARSSEVGDSSVREVALAGKDTEPTGGPSPGPPVVSPLPDDVPIAPTSAAAAHHARESSEISSLSSDEDTRGRSSIRLADTLGLPTNEPSQGHTSEAHRQPTNKRAGMVVPDMPNTNSIAQSSTSGGEFEEAKDSLDSDGLSPPPAVLPGSEEEGKKSSSPARDSKFVEVL